MIFMKKLLLKSIVLAASAFLIASAGTMSVSADEITEEELAAAQANENFMFGDLDEDGTADLTDMTMLSQHLLRDIHLSPALVPAADVMYDNEINTSDLALFKQFVMDRNNIVLGYEEMTDVTEKCSEYRMGGHVSRELLINDEIKVIKDPYYIYKNGMFVDSMEKYNEVKKDLNLHEYEKMEETENISDEFFRNNRLVFWSDYAGIANGDRYDLTSVKERHNGDVVLNYDAWIPCVKTLLGRETISAVVVPANSEGGQASLVFNTTYINYNNSSDYVFEGDEEHCDTEENVLISSYEEYCSYVSEEWRASVREVENNISIDEEFFKTMWLAVWCDVNYVSNGAEITSNGSYSYDSNGNVYLRYTRLMDQEFSFEKKKITYFVKPVRIFSGCTAGNISLEFVDRIKIDADKCREYKFDHNDIENPDKPTESIWETVITSFEEYEEYMEDERRANIREIEKTENISEEFFDNNCIAIWEASGNNSPGVRFALKNANIEIETGRINLEYSIETIASIKETMTYDYFVTVIPYNAHKKPDYLPVNQTLSRP